MEKYIKLNSLGKGSNGSVNLVKNIESNTVKSQLKPVIVICNENAFCRYRR